MRYTPMRHMPVRCTPIRHMAMRYTPVRHIPTLQCWAFDIFACPVTSCEYEQAFSSANKLITPERNSLGDNVIEALECLRAWWNNGLIKRLYIEGKMYATSVFYSQIYPSLLPGRQFPNLAVSTPFRPLGSTG
jgi:hypothetical protein